MEKRAERWDTKKRILVILAHPDDPEYFCGGTLAKWSREGHEIHYCLITNGNKGSIDTSISPNDLTKLRYFEQEKAAEIIGVKHIQYLGYEDGTLEPGIEVRKVVARVIRTVKPDIVMTCDPTNFFPNENYINHPDHRAAGQIAIDAVFPAAGNVYFFPELINDENLLPHPVEEVWLSLTHQPDIKIDITNYFEFKLEALHEHKSQIGDMEAFDQRMRIVRHTSDSTDKNPRYEEYFKRIVFRK